jgi:hypothetical protein
MYIIIIIIIIIIVHFEIGLTREKSYVVQSVMTGLAGG